MRSGQSPRGPPGSASSAKPKTVEQELAEENRRLRAEVAYLKKLRALEAAKRDAGEMPGDQGAFRGRAQAADLLAASGVPASTYHYNKAKGPKAPTRPELWEGVAEVFSRTANGCGHRQIAMCLRAEKEASVANKTVLKIMHEMGISCGIRRETDYHKYNSYKGRRRRDLRGPARPRLLGRRAVAEAGHGRHRVQAEVGQGLPGPGLRLRQQGDRCLVDIGASGA